MTSTICRMQLPSENPPYPSKRWDYYCTRCAVYGNVKSEGEGRIVCKTCGGDNSYVASDWKPHYTKPGEPRMHPQEAPTNEPCNDGLLPHTKFETRMEAALRESKAKARQIEADMIAADAKGELWTVQAALKPGRVFCLIYHGRHDDTEPLESQHGGDAIFGPLHLMGTHREVQAEALKLFTVDEITIRTIR